MGNSPGCLGLLSSRGQRTHQAHPSFKVLCLLILSRLIPSWPTASPVETPGGSCVETCPVKLPTPCMEPCTIDTPGMCVMTFPLQHNILTVELCPSDGTEMPLPPDELCTARTLGSCLEDVCLGEPCTLEVLEPCCAQGVGMDEPCPAQPSGFTELGVSPGITEPSAPGACTAQGTPGLGDTKDTAKDSKSCSSFRLNSRTSSIVERCLSRCQNWFRGKNGEK
ncbi:hypothetical protein BTVI_106283 [Pitangus sulphuratus]|nr:hypothetical protein BTVI_106283 [Pitangus sulphuratus]